jgi:hypothetical protein
MSMRNEKWGHTFKHLNNGLSTNNLTGYLQRNKFIKPNTFYEAYKIKNIKRAYIHN